MQWGSRLLLAALGANSALAHAHGRHSDRHQKLDARQNIDVNADVEIVYTTKTVLDLDIITVTQTIIENSATVVPTSVTVDNEVGVSVSVAVSVDLIPTTSASASTTLATTTSASAATTSTASAANWASVPSDGVFSRDGFGEATTATGSGVTYVGNVGNPWGSNIIEVSADEASQYKYVVQFTGSNTNSWIVVIWNKIGPDGKMDGWYGHSALSFILTPGESRYVAFDEDSQGGWGAAEGDSLPVDEYGGYASTWGEFDFGDSDNDGWSGWDVSAIQAQNAGLTVQGMHICDNTGGECSYITTDAEQVVNAYTASDASTDGIGGTCSSGAVRLEVHVDYS